MLSKPTFQGPSLSLFSGNLSNILYIMSLDGMTVLKGVQNENLGFSQ
jgi:hypothetical protein